MEVLAGVALKLAVTELKKGVGGLIKNYNEFEPVLEDIASTLDAIESILISKLKEQNTFLNHPDQRKVQEKLQKEIENGQKLVKEYSEIGPSLLGCLKKTTMYTDRLRKLDKSLRRQLDIMMVQELLLNRTGEMVSLIAEKLEVIPQDSHPKYQDSQGSRMVDLVAGGAMGSSFTVLYEVMKEVVIKTAILKELEFTIDALKPLIDEMDKYNKVLDRPEKELQEFKAQMEMGPELIRKCASLSKWKSYKKYKYCNQLLDLQNSLQKLQVILSVQQARDVKQTLSVTENIKNVVLRMAGEGPAGLKEGMNDMKQTLEEVKIRTGTMVKRIDQKGEVQSHIDSEVPASPRITAGLDVPLMELKMKLLKDDEVTMLVLTAPGGSGKTTLATVFCQDEDVKGKFKNNIFFFTVSKKLNFNLIVQGLHQRKSTEIPSFQDEATAVKWLHKFSKEEGEAPVLLVLDDVWSESKSILEIFDEVKMPNFKILVTSRTQFSGYGSLYHLPSLNDIDAMKLLRHSASLGDGSFNLQWNRLAKKIVEHCKGYPLAIDVVGKSLRGKSYELWCKREMELSKSDSIMDSETEVLLRLKSSLESLNEKKAIIKECFVDLGSFPEGQRIPVVALIDMWAELHEGLEKDVLAVANLQELTARSLADLVVTRKEIMEVDDYYSEHFVTQHGLLRQLAVYEAKLDTSKKRLIIGNSGDNLPKCLTQQKDQPKPRLLSISSDETFSRNLHNIHLADVEALVLNFNTKNYALPEFVGKMVNLKVLIITNHGFLPAELSNFHLLDSLPNLRRIRLERVSIPSISKTFIRLKSLKKISLFLCIIGQAFSNCSFNIVDALPNLEELNIDYCNDLVELPDTICNLVRLKKLSITNCHKLSALPKEIGKLDMLEVLRLRSCTDLVKLPCSIMNMGSLNFLDISDCFNIVELPEDIGRLSGLRKINMRQCSRLKELPLSVLDFENIEEVICDEETKELWEPFLPILQSVEVRVVKQEFFKLSS